MKKSPSPGNSINLRLKYKNETGMLSKITGVIAEAEGDMSDITIVTSDRTHIVRDVAINTKNEEHATQITKAVGAIDGIEVMDVYDRTFRMHEGGKLEVLSTTKLQTTDELSMAYTPGVARVCTAIEKDPSLAREYTIKRNTVGIVTDGSAVLGLGDIGAVASLPVMEGKAVLFREFGNVNAFPVCVDTKDTEVLVETAIAVAATFGGINLEDIAAPKCFEVERRVSQAVDIPIFHDDQHGTAVVVGAAFLNAVKLTGKNPKTLRCLVCGAGAAGVACTRALLDLGIGDVIICDRKGAIHKGREDLTPAKKWLAENTNRENKSGSLQDVLPGAHMFLGLSGPDLLTGDDIRKMEDGPIVFALSNPTPEVPPEEIMDYASVVATGRSDYANQINNVLCFPALFNGVLESGVKTITRQMLSAAAQAIADVIPEDELRPEYIIPSSFNPRVLPAVSNAVIGIASDPGMEKTPIYFEF